VTAGAATFAIVADRPLPLVRPSSQSRTTPRAFLSMSTAELFAGAGSKPGVEVWRIEQMRPVKQPDGFSGKFHTGDSYIVLHTSGSAPSPRATRLAPPRS
jgi:hypothetical protein